MPCSHKRFLRLLALNRTATAVLTTATRAATTSDWRAVPELLRRREVSTVFVEGAASLVDADWAAAREASAEVVIDCGCECCVETNHAVVAAALAEAFWEDDAPYAARAAPGFVALAQRFDGCLGAASDGGRVRVRATVAVGGRATQPCPRLHTDDVVLRGLVVLEGAETVVAPSARLEVDRLLPTWALSDAPVVSPPPGAACLMKGRRWPGLFAAAAAHRSPAPTDGRRVLVALDRLCDVT